MAQYMVVYLTDELETGVVFKGTIAEAEKTRQDIECGCGWFAQIYEWVETRFGYEYVCIIG